MSVRQWPFGLSVSTLRGVSGGSSRRGEKRPAQIEGLEQRVLFAAGVLDSSFNSDGIVTQTYNSTNDGVRVALQSDGKSIVVGDTQAAGGHKIAFVSRYNADGSVDTTFGSGGKVFITGLSNTTDNIATGVAVGSDGKIFVSGVTGNMSLLTGDFFVAAYNADGTPDTTFNATGLETIDFGGADAGSALLVNSTGLVVVGTSLQGVQGSTAYAFVNFDGTIAHKATIASSGAGMISAATSVAQAGGQIAIGGVQFNAISGQAQFSAQLLNADGSQDLAFGTGGTFTTSFGRTVEVATGIAFDATKQDLVLAGVSADGLTSGLSPAVPLTGASHATTGDFAVARISMAGALDRSFNSSGKETFHSSTSGVADLSAASDVAIQSDGKIIVAGGSQVAATGDSNFFTARLTTAGVLDPTWNGTGTTVTDLGASDGAFGITIQSDGRVLEVGHTKINTTNGAIAIVRYTSDTAGTPPVAAPPPVVAPPINTPQLSISDISLNEGNSGTTNAVFTVTLAGPPVDSVTVNYATANGTATAGSDYLPRSGTLIFSPGSDTQQIVVPVIGDATFEGNETFSVNLSNVLGHAVIVRGTGTGTIVNDDPAPVVGSTPPPVTPIVTAVLPNVQVARVTTTLAGTVLAGSKDARGTALVVLTNNGTRKTAGTVVVKLFTSTDGTLDGADFNIGSAKKKIRLDPGHSVTIRVKVKLSEVTPAGDYQVLAQAVGTGVADTGSVGAMAGTLHVVAPVITLSGSATPQATKAVQFNKRTSLFVPLTNTGNFQAKGKVTFDLLVTTDGTMNTLVTATTATANVNLEPGESKVTKLVLKRVPPTTLNSGGYVLLVQIAGTTATTLPANTTNGSTVATIPFTMS